MATNRIALAAGTTAGCCCNRVDPSSTATSRPRVDALLAETRSAVRALGCAAGSSDLGFLVTPGRLVTIFAHERRGLEVVAGSPDVWVDHRHRYLDRYPALHVRAAGGAVRVQVPATRPLVADAGDRLTLWARVEAATTVTVNGTAVPLAPGARRRTGAVHLRRRRGHLRARRDRTHLR